VSPGYVDLGDAGVPEPAQQLGLELEPSEGGGGVDPRPHHLHRHHATWILLQRLVDSAHAAGGDDPLDGVAADSFGHLDAGYATARGASHRPVPGNPSPATILHGNRLATSLEWKKRPPGGSTPTPSSIGFDTLAELDEHRVGAPMSAPGFRGHEPDGLEDHGLGASWRRHPTGPTIVSPATHARHDVRFSSRSKRGLSRSGSQNGEVRSTGVEITWFGEASSSSRRSIAAT
jgi:hypothetical protein